MYVSLQFLNIHFFLVPPSMESSETPLMIPFKSKKSLLTTPNKKKNETQYVGPAVVVSERANSNPVTWMCNQNFALSTADVQRAALQLRKPNLAGSDPPKMVPEKLLKNGTAQKSKGSDKSISYLPEKYEMLCNFFIAMVNSIRVLRLKGTPGTLTKLAHKIENLTDRRFTLHHLAQLKHIMPEVIMVNKVRVLDEKTNCMEEELLVSLEMDVVEVDKNAKVGDGFSQLKKIFRSRVIHFSNTHLEDDDIPEGELPHLFHQQIKKEPEPIMNNMTPAPLAESLFAPSFKRQFSSRLLGAPVSESMPVKSSSCLSETPIKEATSAEVTDGSSCSSVEIDAEALKLASTPAKLASIPAELASTPSELASTPARLMAAAPALCTRKRTLMTPDHTSNLASKSARRRSLKFDESSVDIEDQLSVAPAQGTMIAKDDVLDVLPDSLIQSLIEKEWRILEEKDPIVSNAKTQQQMKGRVPKLFDMICLLFQSIRRTVITKEELIYKLLAGNFEIVDRSEVEEQLKLLQEVAPEFISEKLSISGDTLVNLNKCSCPKSIRAKLLEAN